LNSNKALFFAVSLSFTPLYVESLYFIDSRPCLLDVERFEGWKASQTQEILRLEESTGINAPINASLSDLQIQILKLIENDPWAAYEDMAVKLEKDRSTIKRNIQQLKSLGVLQRLGSKKKGSWVIVK
jgi:predicted HTH transcriptional regulator